MFCYPVFLFDSYSILIVFLLYSILHYFSLWSIKFSSLFLIRQHKLLQNIFHLLSLTMEGPHKIVASP